MSTRLGRRCVADQALRDCSRRPTAGSRPSRQEANARVWRVRSAGRDAWRKARTLVGWDATPTDSGAVTSGGPMRQSRAFKFEDPPEDELEGDGVSASDHVLHPERMGSRGSPERDGGGCPTHTRNGWLAGMQQQEAQTAALAASARSCRAVGIQLAEQRRSRPAAATILDGDRWLVVQRRPLRPPTRP